MQIQTDFYFVQIVPFLGEILLAAVLIHSVDWRKNFYQKDRNFETNKAWYLFNSCSFSRNAFKHAL